MSIPSGQDLPPVPAILTHSPFDPSQSVDQSTMWGVLEALDNSSWRDAHPTEALKGLQLLACKSSTNWLVAGIFQELVAKCPSKTGQDLPRQLFSHFCKEGKQAEAINLLKAGLPVGHLNELDQNILFEAMAHNLDDLVEAIVADKTCERLPVNTRTTTLALACEKGYLPVISQILDLDPELTDQSQSDLTPLGRTLLFGSSSTLIHLKEISAATTAFLGAGPLTHEKEASWVEAEISAGWIEEPDSVDITISGVHEEYAQFTLKREDLLLNAVAASNTAKTLEWLVDRGCNPKLVDASGHNLVHAAVQGSDEKTIKWVLLNANRLELDVNLRDNHRRTPINLFCQQFLQGVKGSTLEIIQTFHAAGADLNAPDDRNLRPLIGLMQQKEWESIAFLINNGASLLISTAEGGSIIDETLRDYAAMMGPQAPLAGLSIISEATQANTAHQLWDETRTSPSLLRNYPGTVIAIALLDPAYRKFFLERLEHATPIESVGDPQRLFVISAALRQIFEPAELMKYLERHPKMQKSLAPYLNEVK